VLYQPTFVFCYDVLCEDGFHEVLPKEIEEKRVKSVREKRALNMLKLSSFLSVVVNVYREVSQFVLLVRSILPTSVKCVEN
jgi:hypothetical protein